jgi:adenylate kinase
MRLVIFGPPGAGKGTQARVLAEVINVPHISTGDIFREAIRNNTQLGKQAQEFINRGELVPDEVTAGMVNERLSQDDCRNGFVLDGFPRTAPQAEILDIILRGMRTDLDAVIEIRVRDEEIISRLENRRSCPECGDVYHKLLSPPRIENVCNKCRSQLAQRSDDTRAVIENRLQVYKEKTAPLVEYYMARRILIPVNGEQHIAGVLKEILYKLGIQRPVVM